jgi:uncharacterized repeat protein (TIGR03803 family)
MKQNQHDSRRGRSSVTTVLAAWLLVSATAFGQAPDYSVLHSFSAATNDGASTYSSVIVGNDGLLYGTAWGGGVHGFGTVFRMGTDGTGFTVLHHFGAPSDGATPYAALIQGADGLLYGTTYGGGATDAGTVFKVDTNGGSYAVLYSFTNGLDGAHPSGGLLQGRDGALYGTAETGSSNNCGTVFRLGTDGLGYTVLHAFSNWPDGALPQASLIQGTDGALYGTTDQGGDYVVGTVFRLQTNGTGYSVLHSFGFATDGLSPQGALTQGSDGRLYGTTVIGGTAGDGTIFGLDTDGNNYRQLHSFTNSPDGANSYAALCQGNDGYLYGTTVWGGVTNGGTVFRVSRDGGQFAILHHFDWTLGKGSHPYAGVSSSNGGVFYGTTLQGGGFGFGTVYRLAFPPSLGISLTRGGVLITVNGSAGQRCELQSSSDFATWKRVTDLLLTNGYAEYLEGDVAQVSRFHRAILQ